MSGVVCSPVIHMKDGCCECALFGCHEAYGKTGKFKVNVQLVMQSVHADNVSEAQHNA